MEKASFKPEKLIWTTEDFEQMNWHDNRLHGIGFAYEIDPFSIELKLDIDYIFKWCGFGNEPSPSGFWISPSTLVFEHPSTMQLEVRGNSEQYIIEITRDRPRQASEKRLRTWRWEVALNISNGFSFRSSGFMQFTRRQPIFVPTPRQSLDLDQRGSISFEKNYRSHSERRYFPRHEHHRTSDPKSKRDVGRPGS